MGFLRWFLAISVLSSHSEPILGIKMLEPAWEPVKLFYVISGFYMALVLSTKYTSKSSLRSFYFNRFLRLYPTYFIIGLLTIGAMLFFDARTLVELWHLPWSSFISVTASNLFLFGQDWLNFFHENPAGYFLPGPSLVYETLPARFNIIGVAWTLGIECTFYLFAPFFVRMKSLAIITIAAALLIIRNYALNHGIDSNPWQYRFFPFELPLFLTGMIAYRIYIKIKDEKRWLYAYIGFFPIIFTLLKGYYFCGLSLPCQVILYAIPILFWVSKNSKLDTWIGEFSYPIYISHFLIKNYFPSLIAYLWPSLGLMWIWSSPLRYGGGLLVYSMMFSIPFIMMDKYFDRWRKYKKKDNSTVETELDSPITQPA